MRKKIKPIFIIISIFLLSICLVSCDLINELLFPTTSTNLSTTTTKKTSIPTKISTSTTTNIATSSTSSSIEGIIYDDFQIHFMTLGNDSAGDSIYIKAGETDILIDAGSKQESTKTTKAYIDKYCTDKKLEYVIVTHADADHIYGFTDTTNNKGMLSYYKVDTIIDNPLTSKTNSTYTKYVTLRDELVKNGTKYYNAADCFNNKNGASSIYNLSDNVEMKILYNYYYFNSADGTEGSENNYSVCTLFTYKKEDIEYNFLLTGDLELEGEEKMAEYYDGSTALKTLPEVELFKAGHHGSKTSSNDCLLSIIKPKICVVSCVAGTAEYTNVCDNQFPTQAFISRIAKYTDNVYVTSQLSLVNGAYVRTDMNGNVIISAGVKDNNIGYSVSATNNLIKLKDSEWFNSTTYLINGCNIAKKKSNDFYTKETTGVTERKMRVWK